MKKFSVIQYSLFAATFALSACAGPAAMPPNAQAPSSAVTMPSKLVRTQVHVRGTLESADAQTLVVKDRDGKSVRLVRPAGLSISEVYPIALSDIAQGSFVGTSAEAGADGTLQALEVHVFPESARGSGEGHYPWDLQQGATMTNATVAMLAPAPASVRRGKQLRLSYQGGEENRCGACRRSGVHVASGQSCVAGAWCQGVRDCAGQRWSADGRELAGRP